MKRIILVFIVLGIITSESYGQNGFFENGRGGDVGFFRMTSSNDGFDGKSIEAEIHARSDGWVEIERSLPNPVERTNESIFFRKLVELMPSVSNVFLYLTFQISSDGQNYYQFLTTGVGISGVDTFWVPVLIPIQGSPPLQINSVRIKYRVYFDGPVAQDSILMIVRLDYWVATIGGQVIRVIENFEEEPTSIKNQNTGIPGKYSLSQNYPNPFNPVTNIRFEIPKSGFVKLIIFDALGRELETLVYEKLSVGSYEVSWDGSNYTSGVYFYRLETIDFIEVRKMVLLK